MLAVRLDVSEGTIALWERTASSVQPRTNRLQQLALTFGCSVADLFQPPAPTTDDEPLAA